MGEESQRGARESSGPAPELQPTFWRALQGVWLFTWRSQLTWRRLPLAAVRLLVLPCLVFITTLSPETWSARHYILGSPNRPVDRFLAMARRDNLQLRSDQVTQLRQAFAEEFARTEREVREARVPETNADWQNEQVRQCYRRISSRAQHILDENQFARFDGFVRQTVSNYYQREPQWTRTTPFYRWLINLYFFLVLPLSCVRASGALIRDELQADTLGFLTTRPLSRTRLVVVKYLSQTGWLQIVLLLETALVFLAAWLRQIPGLAGLLPLFLATQFLAVFAWSALGIFLGQVTSRYIAAALLYGFVVEMGIGRIPTNINTLSLMRHLKSLLAHNADLQTVYDWPMQNVALAIAALLAGTVIFLGLAAALFTFFEYHHAAEMQK